MFKQLSFPAKGLESDLGSSTDVAFHWESPKRIPVQALWYDSPTCHSTTMLKAQVFKQQQKWTGTCYRNTLSPCSSPVPGSLVVWNCLLPAVSFAGLEYCASSSTFTQKDAQQKDGGEVESSLALPQHICCTAHERRGRTHPQPLKLHWHYIKKVSQHGAVWQCPRVVSLPTQREGEREATAHCLLAFQHTSAAPV